jgi:hypothetical protein
MRTMCSAKIIFGFLLGFFSTGAFAATTMTTAPAGGGQIVVDQVAGDISYCVQLTGGTALSPTPIGKCAKIGTASVSTNPSLQVQGPFSTGVGSAWASFITNVYTGKVTQCVYYYNANTSAIYGDCAVVGTVL